MQGMLLWPQNTGRFDSYPILPMPILVKSGKEKIIKDIKVEFSCHCICELDVSCLFHLISAFLRVLYLPEDFDQTNIHNWNDHSNPLQFVHFSIPRTISHPAVVEVFGDGVGGESTCVRTFVD